MGIMSVLFSDSLWLIMPQSGRCVKIDEEESISNSLARWRHDDRVVLGEAGKSS